MNNAQKSTLAATGLVLASLATLSLPAQANPFAAVELQQGYQLVAPEGSCGGKADAKKDEKAKEGKCGEGKCGEGKCGENMKKADAAEKGKEASCGAEHKKGKEGSCGSAL